MNGNRRLVVIAGAAALALGLVASASSTQAPPAPVFSAAVEVVRLDVIVLDRGGRPVTGLTAADFDVEEGERRQAITSFEAIRVDASRQPSDVPPARVSESRTRSPEDGRCLFVLFDDVHVSAPSGERAREGLRQFLDHEVREGDWVTLLAPDQQVWWTARGGWEYRQLRTVVDHLKANSVRDPFGEGISDWEAVCMEEYQNRELCSIGPAGGAAPAAIRRETFQPHGPAGSRIGGGSPGDMVFDEATAAAKRRISVTLDGLRQALGSLGALHGHKSVVLISEGFVLLPKMTGYWDVIDAARRANVAVHVIDPRGLDSGFTAQFQDAPPTFAGTRRELDVAGSGDLSDATGGHMIANNDAVGALRRVAEESEAYYLLGYTPEAGGPGERRVRVHVLREGLVVRARSRYFVESEKTEAKAAARRKKLDEKTGFGVRAVNAMRSVADETGMPLRVATLFFDANSKGEVATLVAAELPAPTGRSRLKVVAEARSAAGGPPVHQQFEEAVDVRSREPVVLSREWRLPPGIWQMRVLAEDAASGGVGTAIHTFEVPAAAALRVSTPILTDEIAKEAGGARPRLRLRRAFAPRGRLYCQFSVYEPAVRPATPPRVTAAWELRRGATLVHEGAPTLIAPGGDGRLARLFGLSLEGAPPGEYSLTLRVRDLDSGETVLRTEEFEVS